MNTQRKKSASVVLVALLLLNIAITFGVPSMMAQTTYVSVINPETGDGNFIYNITNPPPAGGIVVNITITDVTRLAGWQVNLTWDPTLLNISDTSAGPTAGDVYSPVDHILKDLDPKFVAKDINNTAGYVIWACAIGPAAPVDHFNGSGRLMCVKFTIIKTPSQGETLSCDLPLDRVSVFTTKLTDPDGELIPFTEQNGYYEYSFAITIHDIAVTEVKPSRTVIGKTEDCLEGKVSIDVKVENQGNSTETFNMTVYANTTVIDTILNITLTSGNHTTIAFPWNIIGVTKGNYTVSAYATPVPAETDLTDNNFTDGWVVVTIPGDINGDYLVDIVDLVLVIKHYYSYPSHPDWNPNADTNCDGIVDIEDLVLVIKHYGTAAP